MIKKLQGISLLKKMPASKAAKKFVVTMELTGIVMSVPLGIKYAVKPLEKILVSGHNRIVTKQKMEDWQVVQKQIADINRLMILQKSKELHLKHQKKLVLKIMNDDKYCLSTDKNSLSERIVNISDEYGVKPVYIASIVKKESHFCENVNKGAGKGLMQVTEIAVKDMYLRPKLYHSGLNKIKEKYPTHQSLFKAIQSDSELNLRVGIIAFLQRLEKAKGNVKIALQNYNGSSRKIAYANDVMKDIAKYNS